MYLILQDSETYSFEEMETAFKRKFIRRIFKVKYASPYDILQDIMTGKLNEILHHDNNYKDFIQIDIEIDSERIKENGDIEKGGFNVQTRKINISSDMRDVIVEQLNKNLLNIKQEGSVRMWIFLNK